MGKVKIKVVKKTAKKLIENHYDKVSLDFQHNKMLLQELGEFSSVKMRNLVAGCLTKLYKRLQHSTIKGVSLRMHEEARERKLEIVSNSDFGIIDPENALKCPVYVKEEMIALHPKLKGVLERAEYGEE